MTKAKKTAEDNQWAGEHKCRCEHKKDKTATDNQWTSTNKNC